MHLRPPTDGNGQSFAKHSEMARGIKKKYLIEHLGTVQKLIGNWIPQLQAPPRLSPHEGQSGWRVTYRPRSEDDLKGKASLLGSSVTQRGSDGVGGFRPSEGMPPPARAHSQ